MTSPDAARSTDREREPARRREARLSEPEFVALVALSMSLVAMSIDSMLPALGEVARELGVAAPNDRQLVLTTFFVGLTVGQFVYGPISDAIGRRRAMFLGLGVLAAGSLVCMLTRSFTALLVGRALAGFGAAGPRIVSVAVVRDLYSGRAMARLMSIVMTVFIVVPIFAPSVGQAAMELGSWRLIFGGLVGASLIVFAWFGARQRETLRADHRRSLALGPIARSMGEALRTRATLGYAIASGLVFAVMIVYLGTAQQTFAEQYCLGARFPLYFAATASSLGLASLVNARLVERFGMRTLSNLALRTSTTLSIAFLAISLFYAGHPPLALLMAYLLAVFFCNGLIFGNFNALAMEPVGHIAGSAAAIVGALTTLVSIVIGTPIGRAYDGTVFPLVGGLAVLGVLALAVVAWAERRGGAAEELGANETHA